MKGMINSATFRTIFVFILFTAGARADAQTEAAEAESASEPLSGTADASVPRTRNKTGDVKKTAIEGKDSSQPDAGIEKTEQRNTEKPAPEPEISGPDPSIVELRNNLRLLEQGKLPEEVHIQSLFAMPLDSLESIEKRLQSLPGELEQLQASLVQLKARLANPQKEIQAPEKPGLLIQPPPQEPLPPDAPAALEGPEPKKPRGRKRSKVYKEALEKYEAWQKKMQEYEAVMKEHSARMTEHEQAMADWKKAIEEREQLQKEFDQAMSAYGRKLEFLKKTIKRDIKNAGLRIGIARIRSRYLKELADILMSMPAPARQTLRSLSDSRDATRSRMKSFRAVAASLKRLTDRIDLVENRVASGGLVGFQVERKNIDAILIEMMELLKSYEEKVRLLAEGFESLAVRMETDAAGIRRTILQNVLSKERGRIFDRIFLDQLRELRRLGRLPLSTWKPGTEPDDLVTELDGVLDRPSSIGTVSEAEKQIVKIRTKVEDLDTIVDFARLRLARWREPFQREIVSVLTHLATPETKERAYSLSFEVVDDLQADARVVWSSFVEWAAGRVQDAKNLPSMFFTAEAGVSASRLILTVLLLVLLVFMRKRINSLSGYIVRKLSALDFFRRRVGILIHWSVFIRSVLPVLIYLFSGYLLFYLAGYDRKEISFIEVPFRWIMIYLVVRQILLGLTQQVSTGRPALLRVSTETVSLLRHTYGRLGLVLAFVAVVYEWSLVWLGTGSLSTLVRWIAWVWLAGWGVWAMFGWRSTFGRTLESYYNAAQHPLHALGSFMNSHAAGFILSPVALVILAVQVVYGWILNLLSEGGFFAYLRAKMLRRMSRRTTVQEASIIPQVLPAKYINEFPLYPILGEEDAVLLPRDSSVEKVRAQVDTWSASRADGSLVLLGEKGIGKTTFLGILSRSMEPMPVLQHTISKKVYTEKGLVTELALALGIEKPANLEALAAHMNGGEDRIVLLDEAHNLFLRKVGGYDAYECLIKLVTYTSDRIFWVLVFNSFAWNFINQSYRRVHYFRKLLELAPWSLEEIQNLIASRNRRAGLEIQFEEMLLGEERSRTGDFELIESADGYFRLLRDASGGNPRVATYLWLQSLRPVSDHVLRVGLFREEVAEEINRLDSELLFALAAVCQHENLNVAEISQVLNVSMDFAGFSVRYLTEYGYLEPKHTDPGRITLSPRYYRQVLKVLRSKHLLFEED